MRILAVAVLAVVLALSAAQNAFAVMELGYDDGVGVGGMGAGAFGVRFSLPTGATSARLLYIRFEITQANGLDIYITGPDQVTLLTPEITNVATGTGVGCPASWLVLGACSGYDVSGSGIVVTGDFWIFVSPHPPGLLQYDAANSGRSFWGSGLPPPPLSPGPGDFLLRVDIDPISTTIPEYPLGLPILAIFMVIGYVLIRRETVTIKQK